MALPIVAIIGRPNVGKSTLLNRLSQVQDAIVYDEPGVTRDRLYKKAFWRDREFLVVDTGGLVFGDDTEFLPLIRQQAMLALSESKAAIFVVDGQQGLNGADEEIAHETMLKVIVFSIAGYRLALPMESVLRVVNAPLTVMPSSANEPLNGVELVHLKHLAISVLNLHSHLSLKQVDSVPQYGQFLIVTQAGGELCALRVDTPPDLVELDAATLRQLPAPYQQHHPLSIASRVAVLPQGKATSVIFLLDMERVLQVIGGERQAVI